MKKDYDDNLLIAQWGLFLYTCRPLSVYKFTLSKIKSISLSPHSSKLVKIDLVARLLEIKTLNKLFQPYRLCQLILIQLNLRL